MAKNIFYDLTKKKQNGIALCDIFIRQLRADEEMVAYRAFLLFDDN